MYDTTCLVVRVGGVKGKVAVPAAAAGQHQPHHDHHQQDHYRVTCGPFEMDARVRIPITVIYTLPPDLRRFSTAISNRLQIFLFTITFLHYHHG